MTATPVASRWSTPRRLRALVAAVWVGAALVFCVGLQALNADRAALRSITHDTAQRIVAADELNANLADLDTELANSLLGNAADRDVANELFELRRSAANRRLVDSAASVSTVDAERIPIVVLSEELGRYLELAARAQWLYDGGDKEGALSLLRLATNLMHARILPAAAVLDGATRAQMDLQYGRAQRDGTRYRLEALAAGAVLVGGLVAAQLFVRRRMRRRVTPPLLAATILAVAFTWYLLARFGGARENLRAVRDDAFNSIHALWRARALAYDAAGDESRWLLDRGRARDYDAAFHGKATQLLSRPGPWRVGSSDVASGRVTGLLIDEAHNVTFAGEEDAANASIAAASGYLAADDHVRALEKQGKHSEAVETAIGTGADAARASFDRLDAALQRTIAINQEAFDGIAAASDRSLRRAEWLDPAFAIAIALLGWLGVRPRLREYA
jgi:hypothetical protein